VLAIPGIGRVNGLIAALALAGSAQAHYRSDQPAQADALPTWKPGDEFEAARKRALAAAGGS
jgi:hypothetical protein